MSNIAIAGAAAVVILVVVGFSLVILLPAQTSQTYTPVTGASTTTPSGATSTQSTVASASTSSSSGFTTTLSCPTTTTTTESLAEQFVIAPLFGNFSTMSVHFYELRGQNSATVSANYSVLQATSSGFKVAVTSNSTGTRTLTTAQVLRNGTVTSASQAGYNFTGTQAEKLLIQSMNPLLVEVTQSELTPTPSEVGAMVTDQSTVAIGPTKVSASNYASNELPVTLTACGTAQTVTKFVFQTGTAQGTTFPLLTLYEVDAYQMVNGQPYPIDVIFMLTSVAAA